MRKRYITLSFMAAVLLISSGCALTPIKKITNCQNDTVCANNLLASCSQGSFVAGIKNDMSFKIIEKKDVGCVVEIEFIGPKTTEDPLQGYGMSCVFPLNVTNYQQLSGGIFSSKLENCTGELKDRIFTPSNKLALEASGTVNESATTNKPAPDFSRNPTYINQTLAFCSKGFFYIDSGNGAEMKFTIVHKVATGCSVEAEYSKNANSTLVGPKMSCLIPTISVHTEISMQKLISDKFIVSDKYSSTNVCSGELYKLIK